jgi:phosphatidylinositol alpha-mannosyltransferase
VRILHLDPDDVDNPLSGGGPVRTLEIYRRMASRHEITVLTPTFPGSTAELIKDGIRYIRLGRKIRDHGSSHHLTYLAALPMAVRRYQHDLLIEDTMPPSSATWTPLFHGRALPLICSVQWWFARDYTRRLKLPFHWGEQYGMRMYRHLVVLTAQMRNTIVARHPTADCRVIPNGVDPLLRQLPIQFGDGILYLGRIEVRAKGLDLLLEALAKIAPLQRPILTIAGAGNQQVEFDRLLEHFGIRPWVRQLGKVDHAERAKLLQACRFTVMPSREETFGMTIAEANASGKVALVFDAWPMNEVVAPINAAVPAFDVDAYSAALQNLLAQSPDTLNAMGEACRRWADRYDWDTIAKQQEAYYLEVEAMHRARRYSVTR